MAIKASFATPAANAAGGFVLANAWRRIQSADDRLLRFAAVDVLSAPRSEETGHRLKVFRELALEVALDHEAIDAFRRRGFVRIPAEPVVKVIPLIHSATGMVLASDTPRILESRELGSVVSGFEEREGRTLYGAGCSAIEPLLYCPERAEWRALIDGEDKEPARLREV